MQGALGRLCAGDKGDSFVFKRVCVCVFVRAAHVCASTFGACTCKHLNRHVNKCSCGYGQNTPASVMPVCCMRGRGDEWTIASILTLIYFRVYSFVSVGPTTVKGLSEIERHLVHFCIYWKDIKTMVAVPINTADVVLSVKDFYGHMQKMFPTQKTLLLFLLGFSGGLKFDISSSLPLSSKFIYLLCQESLA